MNDNKTLSDYKLKIEVSLFLLRLGVFIVMFAWTIDKFTNPAHGAAILDGFYAISGVGETVIMVIGAIEMAIILAFVAGMWKKYTYGFIMVFHGLTTFSSWKQYTIDISLLFFASWPMLAACIALYLLRDLDVKYIIKNS